VTAAAPAAATAPASRRPAWRWAQLALVVGTFAVLVRHVGTGPFLDGVRAADAGALAAACAIAVATTACCAWRWRIVARGLGADLPLGAAIAFYYRSLFLNVALPGGVAGDVHRGISHGRGTRDVGRGLRAVAWERSAGQAVQLALSAAVLLALPSPVQEAAPYAVVAIASGAAALALAARGRARGRLRRAFASELRAGVLARAAWPAVALASVLIVAGHAATFLIAARSAGVRAPVEELLPLALIVLAGAALPNIGGWGPREGITAWAFAAAGLGAPAGVATAVAYGVLAFAAALPGALVLAIGWRPGA
jgi:uncharacterized membrane protein YbhN (UPF0104 family)